MYMGLDATTPREWNKFPTDYHLLWWGAGTLTPLISLIDDSIQVQSSIISHNVICFLILFKQTMCSLL
jgi:hypothetical protein